jgi:hypothetical protein
MANSRHAIAEKLLRLQAKVEPDLLAIDGLKDQLREISKESGEGFTEEVEGLGTVEVKAGREKEFKGRIPVLKPEAFLALAEGKQKKLEANQIVAWENLYTKASSPSVTVRL